MNAFIIHGAYGHPDENWIPWLTDQLENEGIDVHVPHFPTPEGQSLAAWRNVFREYEDRVSEDTVFIAHSLGPAFVCSLLQDLPHPVRSCLFIAGFVDDIGNPDFDTINHSFTHHAFDWSIIRRNVGRCTVFHSDNDPYVPLELGRSLAEKLDANLTVVPDAGHFNVSSGYDTFSALLESVRSVMR